MHIIWEIMANKKRFHRKGGVNDLPFQLAVVRYRALYCVCAITQFAFTKRSSTGAAGMGYPSKNKNKILMGATPLCLCVGVIMPPSKTLCRDFHASIGGLHCFHAPKKKKKTLCRILVEHCFHAPCITLCRALSWW